jgi:N-methylhydantoinase B
MMLPAAKLAPIESEPNPIFLEVMQNAFATIAEDMGIALQRTAYSTNIKDRLDFSCAVYAADGALVAQAEHIPLHLGQMTWGIKNLLARLPNDAFEPGTIYMVNEPEITGAHFPDVLMAKPIYAGKQLISIVANLAHHVDVGGFAPGSLYSGAREAFQEGVRIPPVRLVRNNEVNQELLCFFLANTRTERENRGDCFAQIAALNAGEAKVTELVARYGAATVTAYMRHVITYSRRRMRAAMMELPMKTASFEDVLEGDGISGRRIPIRVSVSTAPGWLLFDFRRSSRQVHGPINAARSFTLACVGFAVKAIFDPTVPANEGMFGSFEVITKPRTIVDAQFPAAMSNNSSVLGLRIVDVLFGALSEILPDRVTAASSGTMNVITIGGVDPRSREAYAYIESYGGGQGAAMGYDGMDGKQSTTSNTRNAPAEAIERYYPLRVLRYGLVDGSGGNGEFRGGLGLLREIAFEGDATISIVSDRRTTAPWGLFGGSPGGHAKCLLTLPNGQIVSLPPKVTRSVKRGSKLYLATAGGGGFGPPALRSPARRAEDLWTGLVPESQQTKQAGRE